MSQYSYPPLDPQRTRGPPATNGHGVDNGQYNQNSMNGSAPYTTTNRPHYEQYSPGRQSAVYPAIQEENLMMYENNRHFMPNNQQSWPSSNAHMHSAQNYEQRMMEYPQGSRRTPSRYTPEQVPMQSQYNMSQAYQSNGHAGRHGYQNGQLSTNNMAMSNGSSYPGAGSYPYNPAMSYQNGASTAMTINGASRDQPSRNMPLVPQHYASSTGGDSNGKEEKIIDTAVVIKNIPFNVVSVHLLAIMRELGLPKPHAFNYHFENNLFRGLAFANFNTAQEAATVIEGLNHFPVEGRDLKVEYKKALSKEEKEKVETEKRRKRYQTQDQHMAYNQDVTQYLQPQLPQLMSQSSYPSHRSGSSTSPHMVQPSQASMAAVSQNGHQIRNNVPRLDLDDDFTYSSHVRIIDFKKSSTDKVLTFQGPLEPEQRTIIHVLAQKAGLYHDSVGVDNSTTAKGVQVYKSDPAMLMNTQISQMPHTSNKTLNRAQTTEFQPLGLRQQQSNTLLSSTINSNSLRAAKSSGDLNSARPYAITSAFPSTLASNAARYTSSHTNLRQQSSRDLRNKASYDDMIKRFTGLDFPNTSRLDAGILAPATGTIGSHRNINGATNRNDDQQSQRLTKPTREPKLPPLYDEQQPNGHRRQHGSRELDSASQDSDSVDSPATRVTPRGFHFTKNRS